MASVVFASGGLKNFVVVPSAVVDRHLAVCDGDALKVLLYLLRHEDVSLNDGELASGTGVAQENIPAALDYWIKCGVLRRSGATLTLVATGAPAGQTMPVFSGEAIALRATQDKSLRDLFDQAERIKNKTLSPAEINAIYNLYDNIGLSACVTALLLEYCSEAGKTGANYLYATGAAWADEGISTAEQAYEKIEALKRSKEIEGRVTSALGLGRALSSKERGFLGVWTGTYGFGLDEIVFAFEQTVDATGKLSFAYMNKILTSSYEEGCKTAEDMRARQTPVEKNNRKRSSRPLKNNSETSIDKENHFIPFWEVVEK